MLSVFLSESKEKAPVRPSTWLKRDPAETLKKLLKSLSRELLATCKTGQYKDKSVENTDNARALASLVESPATVIESHEKAY